MPKPAYIDIAAIERAERFDATIFVGSGRYLTKTLASLPEAREAAKSLAAEVRNGRKGMVYAISAGRSVFVPDSYQPISKGDTEMTTNTEQLSGKQLSILTAILTGGGFKRANSREAAEARFIKVATEAGVKNADDIAKGPFDMAEHVLREHKAGRHMTIAEVKAARDGAAPAKDSDYPAPASISIDQLTPDSHPIAAENAASWAAIGRKGKAVAKVKGEPAEKPASKPAKAPRAPKADQKPGGKRAAILEAAQRGEIPEKPDFSANTHKPHRKKLEAVVALVEAGDIEALKAFPINPVSSSPKAIAKYRDLAVIALEAQAAAKAKAA